MDSTWKIADLWRYFKRYKNLIIIKGFIIVEDISRVKAICESSFKVRMITVKFEDFVEIFDLHFLFFL